MTLQRLKIVQTVDTRFIHNQDIVSKMQKSYTDHNVYPTNCPLTLIYDTI